MDDSEKTSQVQDSGIQVVNVSGTRFEISKKTWNDIRKPMPEYASAEVQDKGNEMFLERHPSVFQSILYYHQAGELHMPAEVCPSSFKRELQFWGMREVCLAKCCYTKFITFFDDQDVLQILENDENERRGNNTKLEQMKGEGGWIGIQASMWLILNEPFYSKMAKFYFSISAIFIAVSLFALVAGTHKDFQRGLTIDEWQSYFGDDWNKYKHHFIATPEAEAETSPEAESESEPESETTPEPESTSEPETTAEPDAESIPIPENAYVRFSYLEYIEFISTAFFSLDLIVRLLFCPFRYSLLFSFLNWVDIFALAVMYARYVVEALYPKEKYEASVVDILHCLQIVRVFRLFRLVKNFVGFRVLMYAFKASFREMMLMLLFLAIAMLLFSTFAYFSGDPTFVSIPDACWWSVVTMTTVGYGDVVPQTGLSKFIGVICAISGLCLIAVIIPIFVNNFLLFYSYSKVWGKKFQDEKQRKTSNKITQVVSLDQLNEKNNIKY